MSAHERNTTAHHEAAHAVVQYRAAGFVGGDTTIIAKGHMLGSASDQCSDSDNAADMRARIVSCYAGARGPHTWVLLCAAMQAGRRHRRRAPCAGLVWDEQALREESRALVERHWTEIVAVAAELLRVHTLDETEVEFIADIAAGTSDVTPQDLERYRANRPTRLSAEKGGA